MKVCVFLFEGDESNIKSNNPWANHLISFIIKGL